jgi:hypothetical protein
MIEQNRQAQIRFSVRSLAVLLLAMVAISRSRRHQAAWSE